MQLVTRIGRGILGFVVAVSLGLVPASALAVTTTPPTTPTEVTPKPAKGQLLLNLAGIFHVNRQPVTITNRAVAVNGFVRPFAAGQVVVVKAFVGRRLIHSERLRVIRSRGGTYGHFSSRFSSSRVGQVSVSVVHAASPQLSRLVASTGFAALDPSAGFGSTGRFVQLIQGRLALLHFYVPQTGVYDNGTGLAIDAYHRLRGWGTSQTLGPATIAGLLDEVGTFPVRYPSDGKHVEGNLSKQLLALIRGGRVLTIYPISSGKPSTPTILGRGFKVYSRVPGYLPDGMYYSSFFIGGYAIHGYDPAPDYPASHGCMRVPIPDAISIYRWLNYGDIVDVYY
jgi:L,D-transpeptidase catalytic domain